MAMDSFRPKGKVVFVLGATATGKSKLAIGLAAHFGGEIVNSDKMQVYDGLPVITNKVTEAEAAGIPHHLIGGVHPDADFTADDFRRVATTAIEYILARGRLPIVVGGSNSYIEALVDDERGEFRARYEAVFVWVDVDEAVLHAYVAERVDEMVERGLVAEARGVFDPAADYGRGVRRSIGVPEMDRYLRAEAGGTANEATLARLLAEGLEEMKANTCQLTRNQLAKIHRLRTLPGWDVRRIDCTEVFLRRGTPESHATWVRVVLDPSIEIVTAFLDSATAAAAAEKTREVEKNSSGAAAAAKKKEAGRTLNDGFFAAAAIASLAIVIYFYFSK